MRACSYLLHSQFSYQVSFCPPPNRVNMLMPHRLFLHSDTQSHFALQWMWHKAAVCLTLVLCVKAPKYILMFDILFLMSHYVVNMFDRALTLLSARKTLYPYNHHHCPSMRLSWSCHFLSADFFLLGSPQVKHKRQVSFCKLSSPHVLLMTDIYANQFTALQQFAIRAT